MSTKIERVKQILAEKFGPATASQVEKWKADGMSEAEIVDKARNKVVGFLGPRYAQEFDATIGA